MAIIYIVFRFLTVLIIPTVFIILYVLLIRPVLIME